MDPFISRIELQLRPGGTRIANVRGGHERVVASRSQTHLPARASVLRRPLTWGRPMLKLFRRHR